MIEALIYEILRSVEARRIFVARKRELKEQRRNDPTWSVVRYCTWVVASCIIFAVIMSKI